MSSTTSPGPASSSPHNDTLPAPILTLANDISIRPFHTTDAEALSEQGNNRKIWLNLTDRFPHPYTIIDAHVWIAICADPANFLSTAHPPSKSTSQSEPESSTSESTQTYPSNFIITHHNTPIGTIGLEPHPQHSHVLSLGYWLGEQHWGKGIATLAAKAFMDWTFETFPWCLRVYADAYGWNPGSMNVLRKIGMEMEGRQRCAVIKGGRIGDLVLFGKVRDGVVAYDGKD